MRPQTYRKLTSRSRSRRSRRVDPTVVVQEAVHPRSSLDQLPLQGGGGRAPDADRGQEFVGVEQAPDVLSGQAVQVVANVGGLLAMINKVFFALSSVSILQSEEVG